ncbi:hypothetical protein FOZG_17869 [Fusarium oxysporum Fo47]|uniref:Beta-lactamase-related domain-containing protein n=1 Tax=Fusarium oxysporum Fo47 TaxID=660027 RepID=W9JD47_FUSOX|nr:hypothetical protein FOZG_17869 [Fusarium oxysporum Fo47]
MPSFEEIVHSLRHPDGESSQPLPRVTLGAVNKDGSFYYAKAFGEESDESLATDGVHFIASSTKFVTTVAVMQCVERGQLNLDADISDILPEWKNPQILTGFDEQDRPTFQAATKAITLRHLLTHSSGLDWAGAMVERVTSMRLGEYMKRYIFDVVSVHDATFHLEEREDLRERMVNQWERVGQELKIGKCPAADPVTDDLGGGGLYSTVTELLKIYHGVLSEKFLSRETIDLMFQPHLVNIPGLQNQDDYSISYRNAIYNAIPPSTPVSFGLGGLINLSPIPNRRSENSLSWSGMSNCYWWIDSKKGIAGVYLSQLVPTGDQQAIKLLTAFEKFVYMNIL